MLKAPLWRFRLANKQNHFMILELCRVIFQWEKWNISIVKTSLNLLTKLLLVLWIKKLIKQSMWRDCWNFCCGCKQIYLLNFVLGSVWLRKVLWSFRYWPLLFTLPAYSEVCICLKLLVRSIQNSSRDWSATFSVRYTHYYLLDGRGFHGERQ